MKRALTWTKRILLGLLAFAVIAIGLAIAVVHTAWGRNLVREQVVAQLQEDFPGSTIDKLEGSPFGTLVVRGFTLMGAHGKPLVKIDEVQVGVRLRSLVHKRVVVETLAVRGVNVFVVEQSPRKQKPPLQWTIELPSIAVDDACVTIPNKDGDQVIENITIRAGAAMPVGEPIAVSAQVRGSWRGTPIGVNALASIGDTTRIPIVSATYGDASVIGTGVEIAQTAVTGVIRVFAPAALTKTFGDVLLLADAHQDFTTLAATSAIARINAHLAFDLAALRVRGIIEAQEQRGNVVIAVDADLEHAHGIASGYVTLPDQPRVSTSVAIDATLTHAQILANARTLAAPFADASVYAVATRAGDNWTLDAGQVQAHARSIGGVGRIDAKLAAKGPLKPLTALDVSGTVDAYGFRDKDMVVGHAHVDLVAKVEPERQHASVRVTVEDARKGTIEIPRAEVAAIADVAGPRIDVDLGEHSADVAGHLWAGSGGHVTIVPESITLADVQTGTQGSTIVASAQIGRISKALSAKITARGVPIKRGHVDADVAVTRRGGRWGGTASVRARGVAAIPDRPPVDADVDVTVAGRTITLKASGDNAELGHASIDASVTGPRDITDTLAWMQLPRAAIDHITVNVDARDPVVATGEITLTAQDTHGELHVRDIATSAGPVSADITLGGTDTISFNAVASAEGVPPATADATLALPARLFDPAAWKLLGRNALIGATVRASKIHVDPALLARFGYDAPYTADVDASVTVGAGGRDATVAVDVRGLAGGKLRAPIDLHVTGTTDAQGTRADITASSGKLGVTVAASTPLTVDGAMTGHARTAPISATLTIPNTQARDVLAMFGQTDVLGGSVGGTITVTGTVADPAVRAQLAARDLAISGSSVTNKKPPTLDSLEIDARWSHDHAEVEVIGHEGADRMLKIAARGNPRQPKSVIASFEAANFDIAPLAAFGTGPVRGARGTLNAALKINGLDLKSGNIRGKLTIRDGRFPLSATLGTLRRASLDLDIDKKVMAKFDGRLGAGGGSITGTLVGNIVDGMPVDAHLEVKLAKVSPIGAMQPQISADIVGNWTASNEGTLWSGSLAIRKGKVYVPPETGNDLLITGAPVDMIFVDKQLVVKKMKHEPTRPWLITRVAIGNTDVTVDDTDSRIDLVARGELNIEVGDGVGIRGQINTLRGTAEILNRRYRIENGVVDFDGQLSPKDGRADPRIDIRMVHDFRNLTLTVDVRGRASKPDIRMSGDPAKYTEGQLISFFAGAEPGDDDSTTQANEAVVGGGLSILSGRLGKKVNKYLPVKFDAISYEAETSASSKAVRFGMRLSEKSYLVFRQRLAARPDENPSEAVLEYQLKPNALLETTAGEHAQGVDLLFRKRW